MYLFLYIFENILFSRGVGNGHNPVYCISLGIQVLDKLALRWVPNVTSVGIIDEENNRLLY